MNTNALSLLSGLLIVNTLFGATVAYADVPKLERDECYILIGRGLFEDSTFHSVQADEDGFNIHINEDVWEATPEGVKRAVRECVDLIITVDPNEDAELEPRELEEVL